MEEFIVSRLTNACITEELKIKATDRAHAIAQAREMPNHSQWVEVDREENIEYEVEEA